MVSNPSYAKKVWVSIVASGGQNFLVDSYGIKTHKIKFHLCLKSILDPFGERALLDTNGGLGGYGSVKFKDGTECDVLNIERL